MDYYDIDSILSQEERVTAVFHAGAAGVGRALDPSSDEENLEKDSTIEIPYWLSPILVSKNFISLKIPHCFGERMSKEMMADPRCVNLREQSPFFYEFGHNLASLLGDEGIQNFLFSCFQNRFREIFTRSHSVSAQEFADLKNMLSKEEMKLLEKGYKSMHEFQIWNQRRQNQVIKPSLILGKSFRKRINEEEKDDSTRTKKSHS